MIAENPLKLSADCYTVFRLLLSFDQHSVPAVERFNSILVLDSKFLLVKIFGGS